MRQDLNYAFRWLRRHRSLAVAVVVTLGLGIGGATAVFSVVRALLIAPLPYPQPDRLVRLFELTRDGDTFSASEPDYLDFVREVPALSELGAYSEVGPGAVLAEGGSPERVAALPVTASLFRALGVAPALGRTFTEDDQQARGTGTVVIADGLWRRRFAGSPDAVGRVVSLDGAPHIIAGVMPAGFDFPGGAEAWTPLAASADARRGEKSLSMVGRLAPGASAGDALGQVRTAAARIAAAAPDSNAGWSATVEPLRDSVVPKRYRDAVWMLAAAVTLLLLLACANVANLLLAQASGRQSEIQIRAALGAPRGRLVRQLLTEAGLLALIGTGVGVLLAVWSVDLFRTLGAGRIPRIEAVRVDGWVLLFSVITGGVACLLCGLAPAWRAARPDLRSALGEGSRYTSGSGGPRQALVVVEVALALMLVVTAGLMAATLLRLTQVDAGFEAEGLLAVPLELPAAHAADEDDGAGYYAGVLDRLRTLPGVEAVGASSTNPFAQFGFSNAVTPEEQAADAPASGLVQAGWRAVTPGFFEAMQMRVLDGRTFTAADGDDNERVVVITTTLARRLWPGESAVGHRLYWGNASGRTRTVVGVVGDLRDLRLEDAPAGTVFVPHAQVPVPAMTALLRSALPAGAQAAAVRAVLRELAPDQPAPSVSAVADQRRAAAAGPRFNLSLLAAFAAIALALAATGVYGMLAFWVAQRRRELALRLVLGADAGRTVRLVLGKGMFLVAIGVTLGLAASLVLTRLLASLLYGVQPTDPVTFTGAAAALAVVAALACWIPARRAGRIDAVSVLRAE